MNALTEQQDHTNHILIIGDVKYIEASSPDDYTIFQMVGLVSE